MSLLDHNELFRQSGPRGMLETLQSRLDARDLSPQEALALLSALHEELGQAKAADPHIYQAYSRFMDALQKAMPEVHAYVVSTWGHAHQEPAQGGATEVPGEMVEGEGPAQSSGPDTTAGISEVRFDNVQRSTEAEELGEAGRGESEEEEEEEETRAEPVLAEADEAEAARAEEPEEEQQREAEKTEPEEMNELQEVEESAREQPDEREQAEEPERDADESKGEEETEGEAEEPEAKSEGAEAEPAIEAGGHGGMEWPQVEEPGEEEPIEGEEGGQAGVD